VLEADKVGKPARRINVIPGKEQNSSLIRRAEAAVPLGALMKPVLPKLLQAAVAARVIICKSLWL